MCSITFLVGSRSFSMMVEVIISILKAKRNFTLFSSEYIYPHSDFKKIKYCNEFPTHALT